jgi:hypothetical protein
MSVRRQIIAALSEDSLGGIATLHDVAHAEQLVDAHRAEVLHEAAAFVGNDDTCDCGGCDTCIGRKLADGLRATAGEEASAQAPTAAELLPKADVVAWLVKKSREEKSWDAAVLASKVARGAVRPNNLRTLPADFFEPGHAYTHRDGTDFKCVAVTTHPQTGERLAMGWRVDSWACHYPATVGVNQWNHEYDGVQPSTSTEDGNQ